MLRCEGMIMNKPNINNVYRSWRNCLPPSLPAPCQCTMKTCSRAQQQQTDHLPTAHHLWCYACGSCSGYYPLNPPCVHCLCCCCTNSVACPVWPVLFGALYCRPLQRRSAPAKCSGSCRPIKQRDKTHRNFFIKTYLRQSKILPFFRNLPQILPSEQYLDKQIS